MNRKNEPQTPSPTNQREIVLDSLIEILEKGALSHVMEKAVLDKYDYLEANQKAFIKRVIEGTIENCMAIDEIINQFSKTKVEKQKPLIRTLLRMSTYQIIYMDKVPDSAVCNEAVKLASKRGFRTLGGFVNGVLRNISRNKNNLNVQSMSNCPEWIVEHLKSCYGDETANKIIEDIQKEHPVTIRIRNMDNRELVNSKHLTKIGTPDYAYAVNKGVSIKSLPGYEEGDFIVQDISSMFVAEYAGIKKGDVVLDVCAAPGGKTIHAYDCGGQVEARDLTVIKTDIIRNNLERCNINDVNVKEFDASVLDESMVEKVDVLIADLPCSGLGVMGRKADIKFKTSKADMDELVKIQKDIIDSVWKYVKPGGTMMYSTCTLNPEENENQVKYIIDNYPFLVERERQFIPGVDETDGFYIAKLIRK